MFGAIETGIFYIQIGKSCSIYLLIDPIIAIIATLHGFQIPFLGKNRPYSPRDFILQSKLSRVLNPRES
jgi:hypothetical protein